MSKPTRTSPSFATLVKPYFAEYLIQQRALSPQAIAAYRDAMVLFLEFAQSQLGKAPVSVTLVESRPDLITAFLATSTQRHNCVRSRNARLAACDPFKFAAHRDLSSLPVVERALGIPAKAVGAPPCSVTASGDAPGFHAPCHLDLPAITSSSRCSTTPAHACPRTSTQCRRRRPGRSAACVHLLDKAQQRSVPLGAPRHVPCGDPPKPAPHAQSPLLPNLRPGHDAYQRAPPIGDGGAKAPTTFPAWRIDQSRRTRFATLRPSFRCSRRRYQRPSRCGSATKALSPLTSTSRLTSP